MVWVEASVAASVTGCWTLAAKRRRSMVMSSCMFMHVHDEDTWGNNLSAILLGEQSLFVFCCIAWFSSFLFFLHMFNVCFHVSPVFMN